MGPHHTSQIVQVLNLVRVLVRWFPSCALCNEFEKGTIVVQSRAISSGGARGELYAILPGLKARTQASMQVPTPTP